MYVRSLFAASFFVLIGFSGCGGVSGENGSDPFSTDDATTTNIIKIGFFDESGTFKEGQVGVSLSPVNGVFEISAGGSVGFNVTLVDGDNQRVTYAYMVDFTSNCVIAGQATLGSDISTVNGEASSTFTDDGCAGSSGTKDQITATVVTTDETLTATQEIGIRPEVIGGISFSSALPESVVLQGSGDIGDSQSIVTFVVNNNRNEPLANQTVEFSLSTEVGNLSLRNDTAISDENGEASAELVAGSIPVSVRVNAKVVTESGETVTTQSDAISVTTGLPNQRSFTFSSDVFNPEAGDYNGVTVNLTARLSDTFSNPVPDNTIVTFTAEGGSVESSCVTTGGVCSVIWTSAEPRPTDHRVTVLATAIGHETLFDSNGNNIFDDEDGGVINEDPSTASGFGVTATGQTGFVDYSEAWLDDNENFEWDAGERFLDYNNNKQFDAADGVFNGTQCQSTTLCGEGSSATIQVRKSLVLVMSSSSLMGDVFDSSNNLYASNHPNSDKANINIATDAKQTFRAVFTDHVGQIPPFGSNVSITSSAGTVSDVGSTTIPNTNAEGGFSVFFAIQNTEEEPISSTVSVSVTTDNGIVSTVVFTVNLL
jgi:hypothetical protein